MSMAIITSFGAVAALSCLEDILYELGVGRCTILVTGADLTGADLEEEVTDSACYRYCSKYAKPLKVVRYV